MLPEAVCQNPGLPVMIKWSMVLNNKDDVVVQISAHHTISG